MRVLDKDILDIADTWWAGTFACDPGALRPAAPHVQSHDGRMEGAEGIWIMVVGGAPLSSLPPAAMDALAARARRWTSELVSDHGALSAELEALPVTRIVGPAYIGYGTAKSLDLSLAPRARALTPTDHDAVARLRERCHEEDWDNGGSDPESVPTFGCFDTDGALLALAGYKTWGEVIAHLSIVSAPASGGQGHGSAAVAAAAQHALEAGLLPQYRTLAANAPSMGIASKLGFERYGFSVFVRLAMPEA